MTTRDGSRTPAGPDITTQSFWVPVTKPGTTTSPKARRPLGRYAVFAIVAVLGLGAISNAVTPTDDATPTPSASPSNAPAAGAATPAAQTIAPTTEPTAAPTPEPTFGPTGQTQVGTVIRIVDGDTIRVEIDGIDYPVRYIGMDTPEPDATDPLVRQLADAATAANAALVEGREVVLERDVSDTDHFGRLLRHVWISDGVPLLVNKELVRQGFAQVSTYPPDVKYVELLIEAEDAARTAGAGLWAEASVPTPTPAPTPLPTPAPTPAPVADTEPRYITASDRVRFEGTVGTYTWSSLDFADSRVTVRWSVSASSKGDCRVGWRIVPDGDDPFSSRIPVDAGESETGNRKYRTPFANAALVVRSTCGTWKLSMEGYEPPPPPTPRPVADGGGGGGSCHPSYKGACLKQDAGDYDCKGGSGNGPNYIGTVTVVGYDEFGLDGDGDGIGCE